MPWVQNSRKQLSAEHQLAAKERSLRNMRRAKEAREKEDTAKASAENTPAVGW